MTPRGCYTKIHTAANSTGHVTWFLIYVTTTITTTTETKKNPQNSRVGGWGRDKEKTHI